MERPMTREEKKEYKRRIKDKEKDLAKAQRQLEIVKANSAVDDYFYHLSHAEREVSEIRNEILGLKSTLVVGTLPTR